MSTRGQIAIKDRIASTGEEIRVYLYQHSDGDRLPAVLKRALSRGRDRWSDPCYLSRIIFSEMIKDEGDLMSTSGFGIDTQRHGDVDLYVPVLDCNTQTISWETRTGYITSTISFEEFVAS